MITSQIYLFKETKTEIPTNIPKYIITKTMMANIWERLRDRLASIDSSTSMIEFTPEYAAHFFDMDVKNHDRNLRHHWGPNQDSPLEPAFYAT